MKVSGIKALVVGLVMLAVVVGLLIIAIPMIIIVLSMTIGVAMIAYLLSWFKRKKKEPVTYVDVKYKVKE